MELEVHQPPADLMEKVRCELQQIFVANAEVLAARCTEACVRQVWAACLARLASQAELLPPPPSAQSPTLPPSRTAPSYMTPARSGRRSQSDLDAPPPSRSEAGLAVASSSPTGNIGASQTSSVLPRLSNDAPVLNASSPTARLSLSSVSSSGATLTEGITQAVQALSSSATPSISPPYETQTPASIRAVSPACSQKMQQKMEARFDVMKDAPRCSFFEPPSSSPAAASTAPGFSPKGEPAIDTAASQSTPDLRGRSSEDSHRISRPSSRGRSPEEDRRASLSYYTPLRGDVPVDNRTDAVPSSSSAAPPPVPGDILEDVRRNSQASQHSVGAPPSHSESTVEPPAPLPPPPLEGTAFDEIPERSQASPNSIAAAPPPGADERRASSELRSSDDRQDDVPASSSTAPAPTGDIMEDVRRTSQTSQRSVGALPPHSESTVAPPAPLPPLEGDDMKCTAFEEISERSEASPNSIAAAPPPGADERRAFSELRSSDDTQATGSPMAAAIRETPLADVVDSDKQASSSAAALDAPGSSSIEAVERPPRWLTNPPLLEDADVNAEEEIEALQRVLGDFTKELGVLEAFASIDGDRGNEDERQDPASGDAVSAAEERRLALGSDDLAVEQFEFQAWLEEVSSVAATLLDVRDRSAIGQSGS